MITESTNNILAVIGIHGHSSVSRITPAGDQSVVVPTGAAYMNGSNIGLDGLAEAPNGMLYLVDETNGVVLETKLP